MDGDASEDTDDNESVSGSEKEAMWMMRMLVRILMIMRACQALKWKLKGNAKDTQKEHFGGDDTTMVV